MGPDSVGPVSHEPVPTTAPPPRKRRRLTWLWILLGVFVLAAVGVAIAVTLFIRSVTGPIDATNEVLATIKAGDYPAAFRLSCSKERIDLNQEQYVRTFDTTVEEHGKITDYDVNYSSVHGNRAEVRYDIAFEDGKTLRLEAVAVKEGGEWRACLLAK